MAQRSMQTDEAPLNIELPAGWVSRFATCGGWSMRSGSDT
jgi:hypothetical protein